MEITRTLLDCIRENVRDTLALLSDAAAQQQYEWDSPNDDAPAELISVWADATYIPGNLAFDRTFTPAELADLATFNNVMAAAVEELGTPPGAVRDLQSRDAWKRVMRSAGTTLRRLRKTAPE